MTDGSSQKSDLTAAILKRAALKKGPINSLIATDFLSVEPSGSRVWRMNYRIHGKQKTITFGKWPELPLGKAPAGSP
ncbi:MAG: DUF4102 domain-containing protein [Sphingomonas sp.]|mgnify:CR=1 FL=1|nr:DUF4102 domain-containing protein [Sphingomonas sp.]